MTRLTTRKGGVQAPSPDGRITLRGYRIVYAPKGRDAWYLSRSSLRLNPEPQRQVQLLVKSEPGARQ
jgi:hypothetical protein